MRHFKIALVILLLFSIAFSQSVTAQSFNKQNDRILAYNLALNGIIGGLGGAINKKKDEKFGKAFLKNFLKGGLGGLVKYTAKYQTYYLRSETNIPLVPLNRALFFAGHSMVMNASLNEKTFENIYFNYFAVNFKYNTTAEKGSRLSTKISATTVGSGILHLSAGDKFNLNKTLEYGVVYFETNPNAIHPVGGGPLNGNARFNTISIREFQGRTLQYVVPHELIHTYQAYDFFAISNFYKKKEVAFLNKSKLYREITKFIDLDYEPFFFGSLYITQPTPTYFKNFFEYEAEHFSSRRYINRD